MIQFYFLSILFNLFAGLILVYGKSNASESTTIINNENQDEDIAQDGAENQKIDFKDKINQFGKQINENQIVSSKTFKLVLGILTVLTGVLKLLSVVRTDVPVVGDFLPALAGIIGGGCLILDYVKYYTSATIQLPSFIEKYFVENTKVVGYCCIIIAIVHFIFPDVLFL